MQLIANGKTVIIRPSDPPRKSTGGVFLPGKRRIGHRENKGVIVAVGPEITATAGGKLLAVGDLIATTAHAGVEFEVDNTVYATVDESQILAKIE